MTDLRTNVGTAKASEILDRLKNGARVTLELDEFREVTLRRSGETYYCDTGVHLVTYRTVEGMRRCLERLGIVDVVGDGDTHYE